MTGSFCSLGLHGCPCGYYSDLSHECTCTIPQIQRYRSKISGPLMDRIDIHIEVPAVKYRDLPAVTQENPRKRSRNGSMRPEEFSSIDSKG